MALKLRIRRPDDPPVDEPSITLSESAEAFIRFANEMDKLDRLITRAKIQQFRPVSVSTFIISSPLPDPQLSERERFLRSCRVL